MLKSASVYLPFNCLCCGVDSTAPSDALTRFAIWGPVEGLELFILASLGLGSGGGAATAVVACEGTVDAAVLDDSDDRVLVGSRLKLSLTGDLGVASSRPLVESFFFFLRRLPNGGIGAEKSGVWKGGSYHRQGEIRASPYWPGR
jgi:hypothetical protein